jgi:hypothetical protein
VIARRALIAVAACAAAVTAAVVALAFCADAGLFRGTLIRFISSYAQRPVAVAGALHAHLLARHPTLSAEHVAVGSPSWAPGGPLAEIGDISLTMDVPWFEGGFGIVSVSMKSVTLHLKRDATGHANWQWRNPDLPPSTEKLPILRTLSIPDARVSLDDERRHLQFDGVVTTDGAAPGAASHLRIEGHGRLNGHPDSFEIIGDPLTAAGHEIPYRFSFSERSSGSDLEGHGFLPKPFDFNRIDAFFEARGADLRDLYFLTGVTLINTGEYRLMGKILRRGTLTRFEGLAASSGQSDARGSVSVDMSSGRPRLTVDLVSQFLKMSDLGLRAAGRAPVTSQPPLLLSDAVLKPSTVRHGDADLRFRAARLQIGRFDLTDVAARGTIEGGVLNVAPLTADILGGKLHSHLRLDARTDAPKADADMQFTDLELAGLFRKSSSPPPAHGLLQVRIAVTGVGKSVHQVAASANGTVTATLLDGSIRDSLAEMTGVDLRAFGLLLTKNQQQTPLRCAVADLEARDGTLSVRRLVADTAPVLITGTGQIHLDTETLDLAISGHPKGVRLIRFRSPVLVRGTLSHPTIDVRAHGLQLVDPGTANDADCEALRSESGPPR